MSSNAKQGHRGRLLLAVAVAGASLALGVSAAIAAAPPQIAPAVNSPGANPGEMTIRAYLDPEGSEVTDCHFEYGLDESYGESAACFGVNEVQRLIVRASAGQFKLTFNAETTTDLAFNASAEEVQAALEALSSIGAGNVSVSGGAGDPSGAFPYRIAFGGALAETDVAKLTAASGTTPLTGTNKGAAISLVTNGDSPYGSGSEPVLVQAHLSDLDPGATYHFRLSATNGSGTEAGPDGSFVPTAEEEAQSCANEGRLGTGFLPDCRAWELASPPDKNGGDVMPISYRTRIADDGNAAVFASLTAFGDAIGTGVAVEYESIRGTDPSPGANGWSTHAITPAGKPLSVALDSAGLEPHYLGDLSADLDQGVLLSPHPLTEDPSTAEAANLYLRDDLRTSGAGSYQLLTKCPRCDAENTQVPQSTSSNSAPFYGGATADFKHIVFEEKVNLTPDAPLPASRPRAYEWDSGQLRLAGLIPSGAAASCGGAGPACVGAGVSLLGGGLGSNRNANTPIGVISTDGQRVFFTVPTNGSGTVDPKQFTGRIYVRTAATTTDEITASERTDCAGDPTCGGNGKPDPAPVAYAPSLFWEASADGSGAFFTSTRALTDDAAINGNQKLYMYDTTKPASDPHNLTLIASAASEVIGIGGEGSYVYFINSDAIYAWHEGQLSFIGSSTETGELPTTGNSPQARITPDGRHLLLTAQDGSGFPIGYDHGICNPLASRGCRELYLYSADTDTLACVSCNPSGEPAMADASSSATDQRHKSGAVSTRHQNRAVSDDGKRVFFTTAEALLAQDTNGRNDVYEYDVPTAQLHLISSGTSSDDSYLVEVSPSGDDAFFVTRERLSGWDTDGSYDLYDARVNGGFPEPPPVTAPCLGDSCRPASPPPPSGTTAQSAGFVGPGNPQVRRGCPKGQHLVKTRGKSRCVKPRHKKAHRHHKRAAQAKRGAGR